MIDYDLTKIRAIAFDVDGVLSCSTIPMTANGDPQRTINIKDGYAIQLAQKEGLRIAIITGGHGEEIRRRYEYLGVKDIYLNCSVKVRTWQEFLNKYGLTNEEVIYVGDDIPDLEIMRLTACPCCPADACSEVLAESRYVSRSLGGQGVARDIIEQVLRAQGHWLSSARAFGW